MQQMMDQLQQLMEEGRMAEAAELMEQMRQLMQNMRVVQGEQGRVRGRATSPCATLARRCAISRTCPMTVSASCSRVSRGRGSSPANSRARTSSRGREPARVREALRSARTNCATGWAS